MTTDATYLYLLLPPQDLFGKTDPYVKLELEQDNFGPFDKDYGFQKTSTKKGDVNPVWDEDFTFNIPTLDNMVRYYYSLLVFPPKVRTEPHDAAS